MANSVFALNGLVWPLVEFTTGCVIKYADKSDYEIKHSTGWIQLDVGIQARCKGKELDLVKLLDRVTLEIPRLANYDCPGLRDIEIEYDPQERCVVAISYRGQPCPPIRALAPVEEYFRNEDFRKFQMPAEKDNTYKITHITVPLQGLRKNYDSGAYKPGDVVYRKYNQTWTIYVQKKRLWINETTVAACTNPEYIDRYLKPHLKKLARPFSQIDDKADNPRAALSNITITYDSETGEIINHTITDPVVDPNEKLKRIQHYHDTVVSFGVFLTKPN